MHEAMNFSYADLPPYPWGDDFPGIGINATSWLSVAEAYLAARNSTDPEENKGNWTPIPEENLLDNMDPNAMDIMNILSSLSHRDRPPQDLPNNIKIFFIISYVLIMIFSVVGNGLVIMVIVGHNKMRTVTNTFLVSLAISDMLIAIVNMPFQLKFYVTNEWTLGSFCCKMSRYIQGVTIVVSILTLTGIAVDR